MAQDTPTAEQKAAAQAQADADVAKSGIAPSFVKLDEFDGQPMYLVGGVLTDPHGIPIGDDGKPVRKPQSDDNL